MLFRSATVDELLQFASPGRAPAFTDVLLDTAGGVCGWLTFVLLLQLIAWVARHKRKKLEK